MDKKGKKRVFNVYGGKESKKAMACDCIKLTITDAYKQKDFISDVEQVFSRKENKTLGNGARIISEPFRCCVLPKFVNLEEFPHHLEKDLCQLKMEPKKNDLYQFKQSEDLVCSSSIHIRTFKNLIYGECLSLITDIMGLPLTDRVDMTCAFYDSTDFLLCHDDQLEGRSIAFIFYLCANWEKGDGGTLDLFNSEQGNPTTISESILPGWNKFVFFEVSPCSFHQVAEVLKDKRRITVSGWFHGLSNRNSLPLIERFPLSESKNFQSVVSYHGDITSWINAEYFKPAIQIQVRDSFKSQSQIELPNFLQEDKYLELCEAFKSQELNWKLLGPPNKRHYEEGVNFPSVIEEFLLLFNSEAMSLILSNMTGLALHSMAVIDSSDESDEENDVREGSCSHTAKFTGTSCATSLKKDSVPPEDKKARMAEYISSVRKWKHGYYTLLHDQVVPEAYLDALFYFCCEGWDEKYGGYTSYVAADDGDELLRVEPKCNTLALVYVDTETRQFVKYINNQILEESQCSAFYDILTSFFERLDEH